MSTEIIVSLVASICGLGTAIFVYLKTRVEGHKTTEKVGIVQDTLAAYAASVAELRAQLKEEQLRCLECERQVDRLERQVIRLTNQIEGRDKP